MDFTNKTIILLVCIIIFVLAVSIYISMPTRDGFDGVISDLDYNLGAKLIDEIDNSRIDSENVCRRNPNNVLKYIKHHKEKNYNDAGYIGNGSCGFYVIGEDTSSPTLVHSSMYGGEPQLQKTELGKFYSGDEAKEKLKSLLHNQCGRITSSCDLGKGLGLCASIERKGKVNESRGVPIADEELKISNPVEGRGSSLDANKNSDEYVVFLENMGKPAVDGGSQNIKCACFDAAKIDANGGKLPEECVKNIYEDSQCTEQGRQYLQRAHPDVYDKYTRPDGKDVTSISSKIIDLESKLSYFRRVFKHNWMSRIGDSYYGGLVFTGKPGAPVDLAVERRERANACNGEGSATIYDAFSTLGGDKTKTQEGFNIWKGEGGAIANKDDRLKYYQQAFRYGKWVSVDYNGPDQVCSRHGDAYPTSMDKVMKDHPHWGNWKGADGENHKVPTYPFYYFKKHAQKLAQKSHDMTLTRSERSKYYKQCYGGELPPATKPGIKMYWFSGSSNTKPIRTAPYTTAMSVAKNLVKQNKAKVQFVNAIDFRVGRNPVITNIGGNNRDWIALYYTGYLDTRYIRSYDSGKNRTIKFKLSSDDGSILHVNGQRVIGDAAFWRPHGTISRQGSFTFTEDDKVIVEGKETTIRQSKLIPIEVVFYENGGGATCKLEWTGTNGKSFTVVDETVLRRELG